MVKKETVLVALLVVLVIVSAVQTYRLMGLLERAKSGSITLGKSGGLVPKAQSSIFSALASVFAPPRGTGLSGR